MNAYVVTPGFEAALGAELGPAARVLVAGLVVIDDAIADALVDPVFSRQALPGATLVDGASVSALAEGAYAAVEAAIDRWPGPFTVHAFAPPVAPAADAVTTLPAARLAHTRTRTAKREGRRTESAAPDDGGLGSRVRLVERALLALVAERRRRASRRHVATVAPEAWGGEILLIQLCLAARERLVASAAAPRALARGGLDLAPWPAGDAPVADDRAPPSRAYGKLEEAFQWMGVEPRAGQDCVDLGAAPGSWTMAAARRGARVTAVDRAPLAPVVARLPGVSTLAGDAFSYAPPRPVQWLLSDIVCEPPRAIQLVDDWLTDRRSKNLVVTIKFKGRAGYGALAALSSIFDRTRPAWARVKHLAHNKNEVTVMVRAVL